MHLREQHFWNILMSKAVTRAEVIVVAVLRMLRARKRRMEKKGAEGTTRLQIWAVF
jgi:hypothetical protein